MPSRANATHSAALHRIRSLDGLRAFSILLVIGLHTAQRLYLNQPMPVGVAALFNGGLGVFIFFVISGYLITRLLLHEQQTRHRISISGFYLKRAFRILPPLYLYLAALAILALLGRLTLPHHGLLPAALFVQNYSTIPTSWAVEHFWSLSVEEQFYFLWPPVLILCLRAGPARGRHRAALITLAVIALSPIVRVVSFRSGSAFLHHGNGIHMHADALMFGCAAALLEGRHRFERLYATLTRFPVLPFLALALCSLLDARFHNYWNFTIGDSLAGLFVVTCLLWCVRNASSPLGRLLNHRVVAHIGVISYSAYLWQCLFLHHNNIEAFAGLPWLANPPASWLLILLAAEISYFGVERPSLALRNRVLRAIPIYRPRPLPTAGPAAALGPASADASPHAAQPVPGQV